MWPVVVTGQFVKWQIARVRLYGNSEEGWEILTYRCIQKGLKITQPQIQLTFWRRNYFFLILAHPVYKMWIIQDPNKLET
jgi:hypothetical protein